MRLIPIILVSLLLLMPSCRVPQWQLFQKTIPAPAVVTAEQREAWAQGASWLELDYAKGHPDPQQGQDVASALSSSIGKPQHVENKTGKLVRHLEQVRKTEVSERKKRSDFLSDYQGMPVEGTGFNALGFFGSYWFWLLVVIAIVLSGGGPILIIIFRTMRRTILSLARSVEEMRKEDPEAAERFEKYAARYMDTKAKRVIQKEKPTVYKEMTKARLKDVKARPFT